MSLCLCGEVFVGAAALALPSLCAAQIADYPTLDRIVFVEECIRNHPERLRQEMVYKCACAIDALAEEVPYSQYTDASTALNAGTIAGERGNVARGDDIRDQAKRFKASLARAYKSCLIAP
ncbi:MAG: hypothetical protein ACKVQA_04350 [Burkholderiales bacterium]